MLSRYQYFLLSVYHEDLSRRSYFQSVIAGTDISAPLSSLRPPLLTHLGHTNVPSASSSCIPSGAQETTITEFIYEFSRHHQWLLSDGGIARSGRSGVTALAGRRIVT